MPEFLDTLNDLIEREANCFKGGTMDCVQNEILGLFGKVRTAAYEKGVRDSLEVVPNPTSVWRKMCIQHIDTLRRVDDRDELIKEIREAISTLLT